MLLALCSLQTKDSSEILNNKCGLALEHGRGASIILFADRASQPCVL